ncbi:MAG TPA: flagellin [Solirubrobacteraceae bacterium]|jgi:flagellin
MSLTINTNIQALNAQRNLSHTENSVAMSMEHLSSGLKINSAADDVAGYAINERLQSQIGGLAQAQQNSQDAVALAQTAQGALNEVSQMLQRVRELAVQYENGTNSATDKEAIEGEVTQLNGEIKRVGETTSFNGIALLSAKGEISFQVGANEGASEKITVKTIALSEAVKEVKLSEKESIKNVESAIASVAKAAGEFGAVQDRLQYTQSNLAVYSQNLTAAKSSIADVDMAAEVTNFTKNQVLVQAGVSVLTQANSLPQAVLKLLGG